MLDQKTGSLKTQQKKENTCTDWAMCDFLTHGHGGDWADFIYLTIYNYLE